MSQPFAEENVRLLELVYLHMFIPFREENIPS